MADYQPFKPTSFAEFATAIAESSLEAKREPPIPKWKLREIIRVLSGEPLATFKHTALYRPRRELYRGAEVTLSMLRAACYNVRLAILDDPAAEKE